MHGLDMAWMETRCLTFCNLLIQEIMDAEDIFLRRPKTIFQLMDCDVDLNDLRRVVLIHQWG